MKHQRINYSDIMSLGFKEVIEDDEAYFNQYGFAYAIVEKQLTDQLYLNWEKETGFCEMVRVDNPEDCNIKKRMWIRDLDQLKIIIDFFCDDFDHVWVNEID